MPTVQRIALRGHFFTPAGPAVNLGTGLWQRHKGLGSQVWPAPDEPETETTDAVLFVGRAKGKQDKNTTGRCAAMPRQFRIREADAEFARLREEQIGAAWGASRQSQKGWYEGEDEDSVAFRVIFIPNAREPDLPTFKRNMNKLAENMSRLFCQDEVIVQLQTGEGRRTAASFTWDPAEAPALSGKKRRRSKKR